MTIKVGSVVRLKSGGPWMTVDAPEEGPTPNRWRCLWFDVTGKDGAAVEWGPFSGEALEERGEDRRLHEVLDATAARLKEVDMDLQVLGTHVDMFLGFVESGSASDRASAIDIMRTLRAPKAVA